MTTIYGVFATNPADEYEDPEDRTRAIGDFEKLGKQAWGESWNFVKGIHAHLFQHPNEFRNHAMLLPARYNLFFDIFVKIIGPKHACELTWEEFDLNTRGNLSDMLYVVVNDPPDVLTCAKRYKHPHKNNDPTYHAVTCIVSDKKVPYYKWLIQRM